MAQLDFFSLTDQQSPLPQPLPKNEDAINAIQRVQVYRRLTSVKASMIGY